MVFLNVTDSRIILGMGAVFIYQSIIHEGVTYDAIEMMSLIPIKSRPILLNLLVQKAEWRASLSISVFFAKKSYR